MTDAEFREAMRREIRARYPDLHRHALAVLDRQTEEPRVWTRDLLDAMPGHLLRTTNRYLELAGAPSLFRFMAIIRLTLMLREFNDESGRLSLGKTAARHGVSPFDVSNQMVKYFGMRPTEARHRPALSVFRVGLDRHERERTRARKRA